jgi:hypothetical protein
MSLHFSHLGCCSYRAAGRAAVRAVVGGARVLDRQRLVARSCAQLYGDCVVVRRQLAEELRKRGRESVREREGEEGVV